MEYKDYYKIIGVSKSASADEIKKAYRKLAKKYHPDKNKGDKAAEDKFKEVTEAYEVLKDPEKRKKYDQLGSDWKKYEQSGRAGGFDWTQYAGRPGGGGQTFHFENMEDIFGSGGGGFSDFFNTIFGGGFTGQQTRRRARPSKGQDYRSKMNISLEDAYLGTTGILNVNGDKLRIKIQPGVKNEQTLRLKGKGGSGTGGGPSGDILIKVHVGKNASFERKGDDLHTELPVDLYTAVLGGKISLRTLQGSVNINITQGTPSDKVLRLKGKGMPIYGKTGQYGDLYVKLKIKTPTDLSKEELELFKKLQEIRAKTAFSY